MYEQVSLYLKLWRFSGRPRVFISRCNQEEKQSGWLPCLAGDGCTVSHFLERGIQLGVYGKNEMSDDAAWDDFLRKSSE
jgi:hypothetical protein